MNTDIEKLQRNVDYLESRALDAGITLEELKSQIQNAYQELYSCRLSCQKEVTKILQLHRQNMRLNALLRQFKNKTSGIANHTGATLNRIKPNRSINFLTGSICLCLKFVALNY